MKQIDPKLLARNIDAYCAANGLSKEDFSTATGVSTATLSQWRKGVYKPSKKSLTAIEMFVGVSIDDFVSQVFVTKNYFMPPEVSSNTVQFPVLGEVAAGYDHLAFSDWTGESIEIPRSYLRGREPQDYFVLRVKGDSMYPDYRDGDHVLILRQETMDRSGQVGVVIYGDENGSLKRVEYVMGEDWMTLRPINPQYPPTTIRGENLEHCRVLGVAKMLVREIND